jgi:hypothetical protein
LYSQPNSENRKDYRYNIEQHSFLQYPFVNVKEKHKGRNKATGVLTITSSILAYVYAHFGRAYSRLFDHLQVI